MIMNVKSLKTNPLFWIGVAAAVYGGFLFLVSGLSIKAMVGLGIGGWLLVQTTAPALGGKIRDKVVGWIKNIVSEMTSNPVETTVAVIGSTEPVDAKPMVEMAHGSPLKVRSLDYKEAFKEEDYDAIAHLAYEAKVGKNTAALDQLRAVNNEFFSISLNRIESDEENPSA